MTSLQISDIREFTKQLLLGDTFDHFLLVEATVTTFNTFFIDGTLQKDYYSEEEAEELGITNAALSGWLQIKPFILTLIKGKRVPKSFKIVLQLSASNTAKLLQQTGLTMPPEDVSGLYINLKYDGSQLSCITGTSLRQFTLDKSLEHAWDEMILKFFRQRGIPFDV